MKRKALWILLLPIALSFFPAPGPAQCAETDEVPYLSMSEREEIAGKINDWLIKLSEKYGEAPLLAMSEADASEYGALFISPDLFMRLYHEVRSAKTKREQARLALKLANEMLKKEIDARALDARQDSSWRQMVYDALFEEIPRWWRELFDDEQPSAAEPPPVMMKAEPMEYLREEEQAILASAKKIVEDVIRERPTENLNGLLAVYFITDYTPATNVMTLDDKLYGDSLFNGQKEIKLEYPGNDQIGISRQAFLSGLIDFLKEESRGGGYESISRNGKPGYRLKNVKDSKNFARRFKDKIDSLLRAEQRGGFAREKNVDVEQIEIEEKIADALAEKKAKDEMNTFPSCAFVFESENGGVEILFNRDGSGNVWTREYYPFAPHLVRVDAAKVRRSDWTKENDDGAYFIVSRERDNEIVFYFASRPELEPKDIEEFFDVFANQLLKDIEISEK